MPYKVAFPVWVRIFFGKNAENDFPRIRNALWHLRLVKIKLPKALAFGASEDTSDADATQTGSNMLLLVRLTNPVLQEKAC